MFPTGSVLTFLMATNGPLGHISHLRIWHDNSGEGSYGSWYLNQIMIYDIRFGKTYVNMNFPSPDANSPKEHCLQFATLRLIHYTNLHLYLEQNCRIFIFKNAFISKEFPNCLRKIDLYLTYPLSPLSRIKITSVSSSEPACATNSVNFS